MEISSARKLSRNLIGYAIQRCRISESLCRLSVVLISSSDCDSLLQISVSDTGIGSNLTEFQRIDYGEDHISGQKWDGLLSITTTSTCDKEIYHYRLNLKEASPTKRLKRLPSSPKIGGQFSGTEVSFSTKESFEDLVTWITHFSKKILVSKLPKVVVELLIGQTNSSRSSYDHLIQANEENLPLDSVSHIECLTLGFENYILRHGNILDKECQACFSCSKYLKIGSGAVCSAESLRTAGQTIEAVIVITEVPEPPDPSCLSTCSRTTEVLHFQDFTPTSMPLSSLNALTNMDWQSYGFILKTNFLDEDGCAILEWENLPPFTHIDIVLHSYHKKLLVPQAQHKIPDRNLVKKALKLALDDLKNKYPGFFLSPHAVKIRRYAPDLSRTIAGLILSSNDSEFQGECASLLGLQQKDILEEGIVESCITEKIIKVIETKDRKPKRCKDQAPLLFEDDSIHEEDCHDEDEEDEEGEAVSILDL